MATSPNGNGNSSSLQRFLIGGGTLLVVILTLIGAILLAMQESPAEKTPVAQVSPTPPVLPTTPVSPPPTNTPTPTQPPETPTATFTAETLTPVEVSPTATFTPVPPAPSDTPTPLPPSPTATPVPPPPSPTQPSATPAEGPCQPPASWVVYQVQVGDTLNSLAARTNSTVFDLQQVNCLESFTIFPGQSIYLPFTPPTPTPTPLPSPTGTRRATPTRTATPISPKISSVVAHVDEGAGQIVLIVTGENFRPQEQGFRAELLGPTTVSLQVGPAATSTSFEGRAPVSELDLVTGEYDLVVINPNGRLDTRVGVWPPSNATPTATPAPPEITRVSPSSGQADQDVRLTIQGRNFRPLEAGFRVELQLDDGSLTVDVPVDESVRPATGTSFDVFIASGTLVSGIYDLLVTNPDGQTDIERFAYDAL